MTRALEGLRILDFTQVLAGPFCAQQLAMLGADIIKIEPPETGDQMRNRVIPGRYADIGLSAGFLAMNMGKRSLALDLKSQQGRDVMAELLRGADGLVHNFRAGVVERLGLDYETVRAIRHDIVCTAITGFGLEGPRSADPAYDGAIQAASGMMANNGTPDSGPLRTGYFAVDMMTGMSAAFAMTAALMRRERTGEGQLVDVAMLDAAMTLQAAGFSRAMIDETPDLRLGNQSATGAPTADSFPTGDGMLASAALMPNHIRGMFEELGIDDLLDDPRCATPQARRENRTLVRSAVIEALAKDSAENWEQRLARRGVPVARINSLTDLCGMAQLAHRNILTRMDSPPGVDGPLTLVGAPYVASVDGPRASRPPPVLGQHSREILGELGLDDDRIDSLVAEGVVGQADP